MSKCRCLDAWSGRRSHAPVEFPPVSSTRVHHLEYSTKPFAWPTTDISGCFIALHKHTHIFGTLLLLDTLIPSGPSLETPFMRVTRVYRISAQNGYGNRPVDPGSIQGSHRPATYILHKDETWNTRERYFVKLSINNHIVGLVHKKHTIRTCLMYHAACKVEFQPFKRSYSQLTFFDFL